MTAFTGGIKRPQARTQSNNNSGQQNKYDRLVTILGYNTEARTLGCEDAKGKKYEVFVNIDEYVRGEKAAEEKSVDRSKSWMGHSIDKAMEKSYPVGSKVILQRSQVLKKDNGNGFAVTEVQRIGGAPNPEADKTFQGVFTLTSRMDQNRLEWVARLQHWLETDEKLQGIDINDDDAIMKLKAKMDEASSKTGQKIGEYSVTLPTIGVQFRALIKTDRTYSVDGSTIYEAVDSSIPFDWMPGPDDENGKEIKAQAHPITGDEMVAFVEQYAEYISNHPEFKDQVENMAIEICAYESFPASNNSQLQLTFGIPNRDQHADKNPLYQLSHRKSFVDIAQTEQIQGRNYAVNGIVQISPNKLVKVDGKPVEIPSYWVNNLHANGTKGHVMAFIRTSTGCKVEPHANLKLIVEPRKENASAPAKPAANAEQQFSAPAQAPAKAPLAPAAKAQAAPEEDLGSGEDFDPFAVPTSTPAAQAAAPRVARFGKKS